LGDGLALFFLSNLSKEGGKITHGLYGLPALD